MILPTGTVKSISILGTIYDIVKESYADNKEFAKLGAGAYIEFYRKRITLCDMKTYEGWQDEHRISTEEAEKQNLRHEIVHAFLFESGLHNNSNSPNAWARNEEMVDWFAINGLKIFKAWQDAGCL